MTNDELISQFRDLARKHTQATLKGDYQVGNEAVDEITEVFAKIRERGVEAREALIQVALHGDISEASLAAVYSMRYDPERTLTALLRLVKDKSIIGFMAKYAIKNWESGEWGDLDEYTADQITAIDVGYADGVPVLIGDRVELRVWEKLFRKSPGTVTYVPGISQRHPRMKCDSLMWVGIRMSGDRIVRSLVDPDTHRIQKGVKLVGRKIGKGRRR